MKSSMKNGWKPKYRLNLIHMVLIAFFLAAGISSIFVNKSGYNRYCYHESINFFDLLHKGDYQIRVKYSELPADTELIIYTKDRADESNYPYVELLRTDMEPGTGQMKVQLHIPEELDRVYVVTSADPEGDTYIQECSADGLQLLDYDNYYIALLFLISACIVAFLGFYVDPQKYYRAAILVGIGLIASFPFFSDFLIMMQEDMLFHFARINGIYDGMLAGEFPVRINSVQTEGLGNLSATMYPAVFLYPIVVMHMLRMSTVLGYKLLIGALNIATAMFTFYGVRKICRSEKAAWITCVFYTFSLYRFNDIYVRAALGEMLAMTFFPLVLWGCYEVYYGDRKRWYLLMLGMTGIIESHVLSTEICVAFLVLEGVFFLFSKKADQKPGRVLSGVYAALGALALNASFLVPFLYYSKEPFTVFNTRNILAGRAGYFSQMFTMFSDVRGFDGGRGYTMEEMPMTIGAPLAIAALVYVILQAIDRKNEKKDAIAIHCLVYGGLSLFAVSWLFPWGLFTHEDLLEKLIAPLQFPWRMLGPASMFLSVVAGVGMERLLEQERYKRIAIGIFALELLSMCFFFDNLVFYADAYNKVQAETCKKFDYLYMYADSVDLQNNTTVYDTKDTDAVYSQYEKKGSRVRFDVYPEAAAEDNYLVFPLYYYPGYEVTIDGEKQEVLKINDRVACKMPDAAAHVEAYYAGFLSFRIADMITLVTVIVMLAWFVYSVVFRKLPLDFCSKQEYDN